MTEGNPQMFPMRQAATDADSSPPPAGGSKDGQGAGDCDQPFYGFRPYQFSTRQLARLLLLRGEALDARLGQGRYAADMPAKAEAALKADVSGLSDTVGGYEGQ
jgi:hypothetical protein